MALVRWEPMRELTSLQGEMNRLFNTFFDDNGGSTRRWAPPMDLADAGDHLVLKADLPGLSEEDVRIEVQDRLLTVSGERKAEHEENREGYYRMERAFGSFSRSFALADEVSSDEIEAKYENGVLNVRLPKRPAAKRREITVKGN